LSYGNFQNAITLSKQCVGYSDGGGKSEAVIKKAEKLFGYKLSPQTHEYFSRLGFLEFYGHEFYGIIKDDFSGTYVGCSIEATLADRREYNLPKEWLVIYFFDDGYMGYLDYSQLNAEGEPPVIMAILDEQKYVVAERVAEDLGDFILELVEQQLGNQ